MAYKKEEMLKQKKNELQNLIRRIMIFTIIPFPRRQKGIMKRTFKMLEIMIQIRMVQMDILALKSQPKNDFPIEVKERGCETIEINNKRYKV